MDLLSDLCVNLPDFLCDLLYVQFMDQVQKWRDEGRCIISGFHSPIEKECLHILFRGRQPVIICPARSIENSAYPEYGDLP